MDIKFLVTAIIFLVIGSFFIKKYKFYDYSPKDMLYVTNLKVFIGAIVFILLGLSIIFHEISKLF